MAALLLPHPGSVTSGLPAVHFGQFRRGDYHLLAVRRRQKTPSVHTSEYQAVLALLRRARKEARVTQTHVAERLGYQASAVSKIERGELRLDIIQLRTYCSAIGLSLRDFVDRLEEALGQPKQ